VFQEVAPDTAALKQALAALLGGGVQLEQITVTVSNASASASSSSSSSASATDAGRRLGSEANPTPTPTPTPHHLGGEAGRGEEQGGGGTGRRLAEGTNATAPSVWRVSVQVAYEGVLTLTLTTP
jgi:hypothetical protein